MRKSWLQILLAVLLTFSASAPVADAQVSHTGGVSFPKAQLALSGLSLTAVTVASNDKVLIQDTSDSNNLKTVTASQFLSGGGGATAQLDNLSSVAINADLKPGTSDGAALGTTAKMWSDLFLASGAVINFNNGDVTLTHSADTLTLGGGDLALGANNITMTGSLGATGARLTKGWFTDLQVTNAIAGSVTGNAATATALATARAINGTNFDGTAAITITAAAGTLTGATLNSGVTASSLTSFGASIALGTPASGTLTNATGLPLAGLATQATNTIVGNATNGSAVPTALAIGSCSTAGSALKWTTDSGFGCNTSITANAVAVGGITGLGTGVATLLATPTSANLAAALTNETGSGAAVFGTSPAITTPVITGVTDASSAASGVIGEVITASLASGSAVSLTTATAAEITHIDLTPGEWRLSGLVVVVTTSTANFSEVFLATASGTSRTGQTETNTNWMRIGATIGVNENTGSTIPSHIVNISGNTSYYLKTAATFTAGTATAYGFVSALRVR